MAKLKNYEINEALDMELGKETISEMRSPNYGYDEDDNADNKEDEIFYQFEIKEDFPTFRDNILKSMKNGIIRALAHDEREILRDEKIDYFPVFDENNNKTGQTEAQVLSCGYEEGGRTFGYNRKVIASDNIIVLSKTEENEWDYSHDSVTIEPLKEGGCVVKGDVHLLTDAERSIFSGVRKEMTYVPGSYMSYKKENDYIYQKTYINDDVLLAQEDNKITWQGLKNDLGNENFGITPKDFLASKKAQINAVLNYIDPDKDQPMEGGRVGVTYHHHIHNYGTDFEHEYIDIQNDYPSDCLHGSYEHNGTMSNWGCGTTVPSHWKEEQVQEYLSLREIERYDISEKLFDGYLKSGQDNIIKYLKEQHKESLETHKNLEEAKKRVQKHFGSPKEDIKAVTDTNFKVTPKKRGGMGE